MGRLRRRGYRDSWEHARPRRHAAGRGGALYLRLAHLARSSSLRRRMDDVPRHYSLLEAVLVAGGALIVWTDSLFVVCGHPGLPLGCWAASLRGRVALHAQPSLTRPVALPGGRDRSV